MTNKEQKKNHSIYNYFKCMSKIQRRSRNEECFTWNIL